MTNALEHSGDAILVLDQLTSPVSKALIILTASSVYCLLLVSQPGLSFTDATANSIDSLPTPDNLRVHMSIC